ncbi:hypothetical protein C0992_013019 [Termitomyces sp. T32_za158]|nr:hypothetical protein C0992_013019 [Termitomyces sp. T32_za158]
MNAYCNHHGIGLIPWAPLAAGVLARPLEFTTTRSDSIKNTPFNRELTPADREIVKRVTMIAEKNGVKQAQIALAWVRTKVASPIVGVNSAERLKEAITTGIELSEEEVMYLEEPYQPKPVRGHA